LSLGTTSRLRKAPDLKIFLSKLNYKDVDKDNAADPSTSVLVALLEKYRGKMEFMIPAEVDPRDYKSIVVHCVKYAVLWGGADLE